MVPMTNNNRLEFVPPEGGRVHVVRVPVRLDREWQEAINAAFPDTPDDLPYIWA